MKIRNPYDRENLKIKKNDYVLEVGPGHHPNYKSNVLADKFINSNYHRNDDVCKYKHQKLICADGENLPFSDTTFDYVICCQVLEHAQDPAKFISELCRVAKRGYLETPSFIGEVMFPKESHKWAILEIDNKIVLYDKSLIGSTFKPDFGVLFLDYLPYKSIFYKIVSYLYADIRSIRYEWKDNIEFLVNPQDPYYRSFFTEKWTTEMAHKIFPQRSVAKELALSVKIVAYLAKCAIVRKVFRRNAHLIKGAAAENITTTA